HFLVAKFFGMRVEAYSFFGLGPRIWGFKRGHTDYRISAIPLGAYVKLYGDEATAALEGGESEGEKVPESELYELRPRWQKFLVMIGGPFMNIVLALSIPFIGAMLYGVPSMPAPIIGVVKAGSSAEQAGFKPGDRIVAFNNVESPTWRRIQLDAAISPEKPVPVTVERSGQFIQTEIVPRKEMISGGQEVGILDIEPDMGASPVIVGTVEPNTPAEEAGMKSGDRIVAINGTNLRNMQQVGDLVQAGKDQPMRLTIERDGQRQELTAQVRKLSDGRERLGFGYSRPVLPLEPATLSTAANHAFSANYEVLRLTGTVLGQVFTGQRSARDSGVAGPVGIFQQSAQAAQTAGWSGIFYILMAISLSLGIFNLLPIPLLDGGQIAVLAIEGFLGLFGLTLSMAIKEKIQLAGLAIILLLMVFTFFLDFSRIASSFGTQEQPAANATQK
ncbi:MAG TPA: RIP metalloprotease RseP, partial [Pyrinomonadaceae bacterium]|nr:RIP metalloprotease RseP [Pyrinomonadaceae bacterium]